MIHLSNVTLLQIDNECERATNALRQTCAGLQFVDYKLIPARPSYAEYNRFVIRELHTQFETDFVLLIQYDGYVVKPEAWQDEFLQYDYIGAPWDVRDPRGKKWPDARVGNGGFSLRSKRFCEASARIPEEYIQHPEEDQCLCRDGRAWMESKGIRYAPLELAAQFSWEKNDTHPHYSGQFGFHGRHTIAELHCERCGTTDKPWFRKDGILCPSCSV